MQVYLFLRPLVYHRVYQHLVAVVVGGRPHPWRGGALRACPGALVGRGRAVVQGALGRPALVVGRGRAAPLVVPVVLVGRRRSRAVVVHGEGQV